MNANDPEGERNHLNQLRRRAEEALRGSPVDVGGLPKEDIQYLLHELQVHQAELSMQNQELRHTQQELEASRDLYSSLYNLAPAGYCTLDRKGRILNSNQTLADLLDVDRASLLKQLLSDYVIADDQDEFYLHRQRARTSHQPQVDEIRFLKPRGEEILMRLESVNHPGEDTHLMLMLSDITEQRRLANQHQEFLAQVELQHRLIERTERERIEIARNIHDGPIQRITGLGFSVKILEDALNQGEGGIDKKIQQLAEDIKDLSAELRGFCNELRPPVLARFGLRQALIAHASDFHQRNPQPSIHLELPEDPTRLPEAIVLTLYRIYQQALNNTVLHARASDVWVRLIFEPQQVVFEIQDNGRGFESPVDWTEYATQGHLGLVGMKERAESAGGTLELISRTGEGTIVRVIIPWFR